MSFNAQSPPNFDLYAPLSAPPVASSNLEESDSLAAQNARLKRALTAKTSELAQLTGRKKPQSVIQMGRGIRRIIALWENISHLIDAADHEYDKPRQPYNAEADPQGDCNHARSFAAYLLLLQHVKPLKDLIEDANYDMDAMEIMVSQLQHGANDTRSDDFRRIKEEVGVYLNEVYRPSVPFGIRARTGRGLQNDITGRLLCCITVEWDNSETRAAVRTGEIDISGFYFCRCFYPRKHCLPENGDLEKLFLQSSMIVNTYRAIFTSPSSAECSGDEETYDNIAVDSTSRKRKHATKSHVTSILHMEGKVTPRSIAYACVMLHMNLTDASQWVKTYNSFNYCGLYNFIVDYFEDTHNTGAERRMQKLLKWWNKQIFPHHATDTPLTTISSNMLQQLRAEREENPGRFE